MTPPPNPFFAQQPDDLKPEVRVEMEILAWGTGWMTTPLTDIKNTANAGRSGITQQKKHGI